jgi:hypothetical protein
MEFYFLLWKVMYYKWTRSEFSKLFFLNLSNKKETHQYTTHSKGIALVLKAFKKRSILWDFPYDTLIKWNVTNYLENKFSLLS